jgi:hypothetical protein
MSTNEKDLNAKIDEYHLMIEEVLGGMDIMVTQLKDRVKALEAKQKKEEQQPDAIFNIDSFRSELKDLKTEITEGLALAFRKINEK